MAVRRKSSLFWISVKSGDTPLVERSYQIHLLFVLKTPRPLLRLPAFISHASRTHFPILPAIDDRRRPNQSHIKSNNRLVWHSVEKWLKKRRKSTHTQNMLKCHSIDDYRIDLRLIQNYNDRISIGSPRKCCTRPHFSFITCIMLYRPTLKPEYGHIELRMHFIILLRAILKCVINIFVDSVSCELLQIRMITEKKCKIKPKCVCVVHNAH